MRPIYPLVALLSIGFVTNTAFAQPDAPQNAVPVSPNEVQPKTPEQQIKSAVTSFVGQLNEGVLYLEAQKYVYSPREGFFGAERWFKAWQTEQDSRQLVITEINVGEVQGNDATALVTYRFGSKKAGVLIGNDELPSPTYKETLNLKRKTAWQIVAPQNREELWGKNAGELYELRLAAIELAQREWTYSADFRGQRSLQRLKHLALGALQLVQDYDQRFAFAPEYAQEAIWPYTHDSELLKVAGTNEIYSFNGYLSDKVVAQVKEPKWTVLFYEGQDEKPIFRYDGKAAIGFVDGHCALLTANEADDLIWKP